MNASVDTHVCSCVGEPDEQVEANQFQWSRRALGLAVRASYSVPVLMKGSCLALTRYTRCCFRLHIPKAGTSFIATLLSHACTRRGRLDLLVNPFAGAGPACRRAARVLVTCLGLKKIYEGGIRVESALDQWGEHKSRRRLHQGAGPVKSAR